MFQECPWYSRVPGTQLSLVPKGATYKILWGKIIKNSKYSNSFFLLIFMVFCLAHSIYATNLDISAHDPIYPILRRAQTKSSVLFFSQNFPQTKSGLNAVLKKGDLSFYDRYYLHNRYPLAASPLVKYAGKHTDNVLYLSPLVRTSFYDTSKTGVIGALGLRAYGDVGPYLTFFTQGEVFTEWTDEDQFSHQFDPDYGETCSVEKGPNDDLLSSRTCNRFTYYLRLDLDWIHLKVGRDNIHMGPGYFSSLTAQKQTAPYYLVEMRIPFSEWLYLDNYFLKMTDSDHDVRKFAHIHRFEFKPFQFFSVAFQDVVIYQDRNIDLAYALPLIPLAFSEDNTGGRDNDAMALDVMYTGLPLTSVWAEVFIDDLLGPGTFFDDFWENRWSVLFGFQVVSPLSWLDMDMTFEYSRVEPWTYNGRQSYTSFRHFNRPSASKLGPDSRSFDIQFMYRPTKFIELGHRLEINDKGTEPSSKLGQIHSDDDHGTKKSFLKGKRLRERISIFSLTGFWRQHVLVDTYFTFNWMEEEFQHYGMNLFLSW